MGCRYTAGRSLCVRVRACVYVSVVETEWLLSKAQSLSEVPDLKASLAGGGPA